MVATPYCYISVAISQSSLMDLGVW